MNINDTHYHHVNEWAHIAKQGLEYISNIRSINNEQNSLYLLQDNLTTVPFGVGTRAQQWLSVACTASNRFDFNQALIYAAEAQQEFVIELEKEKCDGKSI